MCFFSGMQVVTSIIGLYGTVCLNMLTIMITCRGGFSSSYISAVLNRQVKEKGLEEKARFLYKPYDKYKDGETIDEADIVFLSTRLQYVSGKLAEKYPEKPFYVIPTRMYGLVNAEDYIEDAEDVIAGFRETGKNLFCFEGEERAIRNYRTVSHRKWLAKNLQQES